MINIIKGKCGRGVYSHKTGMFGEMGRQEDQSPWPGPVPQFVLVPSTDSKAFLLLSILLRRHLPTRMVLAQDRENK